MDTLYKVESIEGKNLGCVALKDIKKGTLIIKEGPQWAGIEISESDEIWTPEQHDELLQNFYAMSPSNQEEILKLYTSNKFSKEELEKKLDLASKDPAMIEKTLKLYGIYATNKFEGGVGVQASRLETFKEWNFIFHIQSEITILILD